jgi:hypothetical protein
MEKINFKIGKRISCFLKVKTRSGKYNKPLPIFLTKGDICI